MSTIFASLLEPTGSIGDYWYDIATRGLYECISNGVPYTLVWSQIARGTFVSPTPPTPSPVAANVVDLWIDAHDPNLVPHYYDYGLALYLPILPVGFTFPTLNPQPGDVWTDNITQCDYIWSGIDWVLVAVPPTSSSLGATATHLTTVCWNCGTQNIFNGGHCNHCGASAIHPAQPALPNSLSLYQQSTNTCVISITNNNGLTLIEVFADGTIIYGPTYNPTDAAKMFWESMANNYPPFQKEQELKGLELKIENLEKQLKAYQDAGFKLPEPKKPVDPLDAWNAAMGVII